MQYFVCVRNTLPIQQLKEATMTICENSEYNSKFFINFRNENPRISQCRELAHPHPIFAASKQRRDDRKNYDLSRIITQPHFQQRCKFCTFAPIFNC